MRHRFNRHWPRARHLEHGLYALILCSLLAGCAGHERYQARKDAYPDGTRDVSQVPDAVPKVEPLAKRGNAPRYTVWGKQYAVRSTARGYTETGNASFYATKFHGYETSSGEPYDMYSMSAAHRSLPLPSYAHVTNLDNGRSVIVRINDRGPFHEDRIIDLSYAAASRLGVTARGTGRVRVEGIDPSEPMSAPVAAVPSAAAPLHTMGVGPARVLQVAALSSADNATSLRDTLAERLSLPVFVTSQQGIYRVHVGPFNEDQRLEAARQTLQSAGYSSPITLGYAP